MQVNGQRGYKYMLERKGKQPLGALLVIKQRKEAARRWGPGEVIEKGRKREKRVLSS